MATPENRHLRDARRALISSVTGHPVSRDALADMANEWAHRHGKRIALTGNYIGKLERGLYRWPNADYREALRAVLGSDTDADLGFMPRGEPPSVALRSGAVITDVSHVAWVENTDEDDDMQRRTLIFGSAAGVLARGAGRLPATIRLGDAKRLASTVSGYVLGEQTVGGGALAEKAQRDLARTMTELELCDIDTSAVAAYTSMAGNLAVTVGWLHYDADNQRAATQSYRDALALAMQAGDDELAAHTSLNMALQTITQSLRGQANPLFALRSVLRAAELTDRRVAGRMHALISARQALAHASLGDRDAFRIAVSASWREMDLAYDHQSMDEVPDWLKFMCHNEVRYHEANGYAVLGDSSRALELFEKVANEQSGQRNSTHYRAHLASSLARTGDVVGAVTEGAKVLELLCSEVSSARTLRVLEPVRLAAADHEEFGVTYDQLALMA
jgi:hypothetical protein